MDAFLTSDWTALIGGLHITDLVDAVASWTLPLAQAVTDSVPEIITKPVDGPPGDGLPAEGISTTQYLTLLVAAVVLIAPFLLGGFIAKSLKMPTHSTRFGFVLLALIASVVILVRQLPSLGIDLAGGTILVYEIDSTKNIQTDDTQRITSKDLLDPLAKRINPSGTQEIMIRPYGDTQIEIIIPAKGAGNVEVIKKKIREAGILRFAILANRADHERQIQVATDQAESEIQGERTKIIVQDTDGEIVARWARVDREDVEKAVNGIRPLRVNVANAILRNPQTGEIVTLPPEVMGENANYEIARWIKQQGMADIETLMIVDPDLDVKGDDLAFASNTFDQNGAPAVSFNLTDAGSGKFSVLTTNNLPVGDRERQLGIVLDDALLSAPAIRGTISSQGQITGSFTDEEVEHLVSILKAGRLPAALRPDAIAENEINATLGSDTIRKGVFATGLSLVVVLGFMLVYYRFAGVVACIALTLNLLMILATMVLINQPLTLPGLAGLVLTVGMSVDANVLIFERLREELSKGAAARMAIRNGFARATVTIVDANLTTLITAIVLYAIGTDQIRGFAVTLILGILYSMFTAIYMSRTIFDVAERRGFLSLSMSDAVNRIRKTLARGGDLDFMGKQKLFMAISLGLMLLGLGALYYRGGSILDIDFAGGSSVQFRLDKSTPPDEVRSIVSSALGKDIQYTATPIIMGGAENNTVYKVDSSIENVEDLKQKLAEGFAATEDVGLVTYNVTVLPAGDASVEPTDNGLLLTTAQAEDQPVPAEGEPATEAPATEEQPESTTQPAVSAPAPAAKTTRNIRLNLEGQESGASMNGPTLIENLIKAATAVAIPLTDRGITLTPSGEGAANWDTQSSVPFSDWRIELPLTAQQTDAVLAKFQETLGNDPVWISSSSVGGQVAGDMIGRALGALFASLLSIIAYIWFRFQRVYYGLAAVAALVHDVVITLGAIAISYYVADAMGFLLIDPFKISLTVVAALLTIIGYSLNDTIVIFDRIREIKGKAPRLTAQMINHSVNQTLSRTLLTSATTLIVVVLLYFFGGDGIHAFAFSLVVGVFVGTYSSIFIASPILLWLLDREQKAKIA